MRLSQLLYISDATTAMSQVDLNRLVAKCQKKNDNCNITGLLLYSAGHFIQLLEGHLPVLENLLTKISQDPRHHNVQTLHIAECKKRVFATWQMGLLNLDASNELDRPRLLELANLLRQNPDGSTVVKVFQEFRRQLPHTPAATKQVA